MKRRHLGIGAAALIVSLALAAYPSGADWVELQERIDWGGTVDFESALEFDDGRFQKAELTFVPELEFDLSKGLRLSAAGRFRATPLDRLEPGQPGQFAASVINRRLFIGDRAEIELRELTLEGALGPSYWVLGKQQVVWGQADGLKVLDVVNPQSFREFILPDFEDSRISLWALNVEGTVGDVTLQMLWIPDPTFHDLPEPGSVFEIAAFGSEPPPGVPAVVRRPERPDDLVRDSDAGVRLSAFWWGWDLTLNYFYHYHDVVIPFRRLPTAPGDPIVVEPGWRRTHLAGGTASRAIGDFVVRAEAGYSNDRYFPTSRPQDRDGVVRSGEFSYVVGLDWYGVRKTLLSAQLFQSWLPEASGGLARGALDTSWTLLAQRTFWNDTLEFRAIWIHNANDGDGLVRPRASYEIRDGIELTLGADVFYGTAEGVFGQFDQRDRIYFGLELAR